MGRRTVAWLSCAACITINQPRSRPTEVPVQGSKTASFSRHSKPLGPPPGLPAWPPPGLTAIDQTQAVTLAVVGQVQAMLSRFEESFEQRQAQVEARAPREHSRSLLYSFSSKERRSEESSSQEDSVADAVVKVASVVRALPQGVAQSDRHIVLEKNGDDDVLTICLERGEGPSASRSASPGPLVASTEESHSRKRKQEKKKKKKRKQLRHHSSSYSSESSRQWAQQAEKSACERGVEEARLSSTSPTPAGVIAGGRDRLSQPR